jgi:hypothetical protein
MLKMAQRKSPIRPLAKSRESDLQPVYDVLDALQPAHLKAAYHRLDRRTRYWLIIGIATVVLGWSMLTLMQMITRHVAATTGPFLSDALQAPFQLDTRPMPAWTTENTMILPSNVGNYAIVDGSVQIVIPTPVTEATSGQATVPDVPSVVPAAVLGKCLHSATSADLTATCVGIPAQYLAFADYQSAEGIVIHLVSAQFGSHDDATQAIKALRRQAGSVGHVGDYAIGVGTVDFFYSVTGDQYNFTWSNGMWVYLVSGASSADLEAFTQSFSY